MLPAKLDYLFIARFRDGTTYRQTPSDSSHVHPLSRSAFHDVWQRHQELDSFTLVDRHQVHEHTVFLANGYFKTDGEILAPPPEGRGLECYRIIYFRRCQIPSENGWHGSPRIVAYFIGWQANDASGRNLQMLLEIPPLGSLQKPKLK